MTMNPYKDGTEEVDMFILELPEDQRKSLEDLRIFIKSQVPGWTEKISWGMPIIYYRKKQLVGYSAFKNHCSLFIMSLKIIEEMKEELKGYLSSKATLHFIPDNPLPKELVRKILEKRMAEIDEKIMKK